MKDDTITKLYAELTDKERAALAFTYLLQGNDPERKRIESTMPEQYFVGLPLEYRSWTGNLQSLAMLYAIGYWQQVAKCQAFMSGSMALLQDDDLEAYKPLMNSFKAAEAVLLAIEQAFDDVCAEHGLDTGAMRYIAGNQFYQVAHPDLTPDGVCVVGYREIFALALAR